MPKEVRSTIKRKFVGHTSPRENISKVHKLTEQIAGVQNHVIEIINYICWWMVHTTILKLIKNVSFHTKVWYHRCHTLKF